MYAHCHVHNRPFVLAASHEHHEVPRAAGGGDLSSNLTYVCSNCHNVLHRIGEKMLRGKMGVAADIAMSYAPAPKMRKRLMELAKCVADSMQAKAEGEVEGPDEVLVQVSLPKEVARRLRLVANEHRKGGRRVGVGRYVRSLIMVDLRKRNMLHDLDTS